MLPCDKTFDVGEREEEPVLTSENIWEVCDKVIGRGVDKEESQELAIISFSCTRKSTPSNLSKSQARSMRDVSKGEPPKIGIVSFTFIRISAPTIHSNLFSTTVRDEERE
jgi:hypothetical protein